MQTLFIIAAIGCLGPHHHHGGWFKARRWHPAPACRPAVIDPPAAYPVARHPIPVTVVPAARPPTAVVVPARAPRPVPAAAKSLYERLGGRAAIAAVVDDFVARAASDPAVNFTRMGTAQEWDPTPENVAHLKRMLVGLIGAVTGGPEAYQGRDMKAVHAGMKITGAEFTAIANDLKLTLDQFGVPEREQAELLKIVGSTRADIVEVE
jgi:hemoglobin